MRIALKHQIILAPAAVLFILTLLLGFLQFSYWDLTVKRQKAKTLGTIFIAVAEADLAAQRMQGLAMHLQRAPLADISELREYGELYAHLTAAVQRILGLIPLPEDSATLLKQSVADLSPEQGFDPEHILSTLALLRPQLVSLSELSQKQREQLRRVHSEDIDELVVRTAFVVLVVLGAAILLGIFLSLYFARRILRRIQSLSDSAARIVGGDLTSPPAPQQVRDELDELALSITRMTDRLIRVVGAEKLLEGAEEERRRIAMDIHDQTLSDLAAVLRGVQGLKAQPECREEAGELEEELQRAIANLREVMDNLHPQTLEILGLEAALQSHLERLHAKEGLPEYHLYISSRADEVALPRLWQLTLYRIAIEGVHNVLKHAHASRYEINLDRRGESLVLSVEDNGIGMDPDRPARRGGRGLNNIRERARAIGAQARWEPSRFTSGTRFELTLPVAAVPAAE